MTGAVMSPVVTSKLARECKDYLNCEGQDNRMGVVGFRDLLFNGLSAVRHWRGYERRAHTKRFSLNPDTKLSNGLIEMNRPRILRVVRVITGHCGLNGQR